MSRKKKIGAAAAGVLALTAIVGAAGLRNPYTPEGHEGYVQTIPFVLGQGGYEGSVQGPGKYGLAWRVQVENVDMRPQTYSEQYDILTKDNLNISFQSHIRIGLRNGSVKDVVEEFGGQDWYLRNVKEQSRAVVRDAVRAHDAYDVKGESQNISHGIEARLKGMYAETPIQILSVSIGNIDYPDSVNTAIEAKLAAQQELERKELEKQMAEKDKEIRVVEAQGIAQAQRIINETLTERYLQHEAIQAQRKMAESPNHTTIYIPSGNNGIPLVRHAE